MCLGEDPRQLRPRARNPRTHSPKQIKQIAASIKESLAKDEASVNALADAIEASKRQLFGGGNSISGAIDYSRILLAAKSQRLRLGGISQKIELGTTRGAATKRFVIEKSCQPPL